MCSYCCYDYISTQLEGGTWGRGMEWRSEGARDGERGREGGGRSSPGGEDAQRGSTSGQQFAVELERVAVVKDDLWVGTREQTPRFPN